LLLSRSVAVTLASFFAGIAAGQPGAAEAFLAPYGLENFPGHYIDALDAYLVAYDQFEQGDLDAAKATLDALWAQYPVGGFTWAQLPSRPFGINIGSPPCYYSLRMLSDVVDWKLDHPEQGPPPRTARLTVLLPERTSGIQPRTIQELIDDSGVPVTNVIDPRIAENDYLAIREGTELFESYVLAITQGRLAVETVILPLPDADLSVVVDGGPGQGYFAGLSDYPRVWDHVSESDTEATDWWWVIHPSHVPDEYADFAGISFITGGMGGGPPNFRAPCFISDDLSLLRKAPALGEGEYTSIERRIYIPQWMQHEFFHHLYREYAELQLEVNGHDWFNRSFWPPDFQGLFEPDFYHESLYRRIHQASPPPHIALRYATANAPFAFLTVDDVTGSFARLPIGNAWHMGEIETTPGGLRWRNSAGVAWSLTDNLDNGSLLTGPDNPYAGIPSASEFSIVLARDPEFGDFTTTVAGFSFINEVYTSACVRGDIADPPGTDFFDVLEWLRRFDAQSPDADFAPPATILDNADLAEILATIAGACPPIPSPLPVGTKPAEDSRIPLAHAFGFRCHRCPPQSRD
jgi:hypothetical protein